jgi:hypothetical protein
MVSAREWFVYILKTRAHTHTHTHTTHTHMHTHTHTHTHTREAHPINQGSIITLGLHTHNTHTSLEDRAANF